LGNLRVIGGSLRGRVLQAVPGRGTRPLLGQVREALFNILGPNGAADREVWDLFAGTGANGIEALSRGARRVVFVEKGARPLSILRGNLAELGEEIAGRWHVLRADAWDPPAITPEGEEVEVPPDLVFFDPPYADVEEDPTRAAARAERLIQRLAPGGVLCFHFPDGCLDENDFSPAHRVDLRTWGRAAVAIVRRADGA
jgi:16S rRNA (guanine966-N2)-methyltransferase